MTAPAGEKNDDAAMPSGEASGRRWRALAARRLAGVTRNGTLSTLAPRALFALIIKAVLVCGAALAWYMLARFVFLNLIDADSDDASVGMAPGEYQAALAGRQPDIRSDFDVYLVENRLIYVKDSCTQADVDARFFVHVYPVSPDDLPDYRRPYGFDNLSFGFGHYGARFDGKCWANIPLPDYGIAVIRTGQYVEVEDGYRNEWMGKIDLQADEGVARLTADEYRAALAGRQPDIRSGFDVYLVENRLIYVKEQCGPEDVGARFFVHVDPVSTDDLPDHRRPHGFDNLDFQFDRYGARFGETCMAEVSLPDYEIAEIRTGQSVEAEGGYRNVWHEAIRPE